MELRKIKITDMNPAPYNPRKNLKPEDTEYQHIKASIDTFGYVDPIIWNERTGNIVGGHQRYKILVEKGAKEIECSVVDYDTTFEKAANAALNKAQGVWDLVSLDALLADLKELDFDMVPFGFEELQAAIVEDEAPEPPETPVASLGDIWQLGPHRVICGDSTDADTYGRLMAGVEADLVLTDPPYNVDYEGGTGDKLKIQNDRMQDEQFLTFLTDAFTQMYEYSKQGAAIYVFHADSEGYNFRNAFKIAGYTLRQCLIWAKNSMVIGRQDYQWRHEPILYGWKDGAAHAWYADRKQTTLIEWERPTRSAEHPTMKPVGLCAYLMENSSKQGDLILDPFGGSGSTLIAAEQSGRVSYTCELDPRYVDVIVIRWENLTGKKGVRVDARTQAVSVANN